MDETITRIKKMANFQMRKSTHVRFLESCLEDNLIPKGLQLHLKVQVGDNTRLQEAVNRVLDKTSLEICRLVKEEHMMQLNESKPKLIELETTLKGILKDEGKFNEITSEVFKVTEARKNDIIQNQQKKLSALKRKNDPEIIIVGETQNNLQVHSGDKRKVNKANTDRTKQSSTRKPFHQHKNGNRGNVTRTPTATSVQATQPNQPKENTEKSTNTGPGTVSSQSKNVQTPNTTKKTYAEVVNQGAQPHQLQNVIGQLITLLQNINQEGSFGSKQNESGKDTKRDKRKWRAGKRQF